MITTKEKLRETWKAEGGVSKVAQLRAQANTWQDLWVEADDMWDIRKSNLPFDYIALPAKIFKKRTTAAEGWHPRHFGWLSDELFDAFGRMLHVCEGAPSSARTGRRTVGETHSENVGWLKTNYVDRSMYRVYAWARRSVMQEWCAEWAADKPEVNMTSLCVCRGLTS